MNKNSANSDKKQKPTKQGDENDLLLNNETGSNITAKYADILARYSNTNEAIDKETKYIEILDFAFYVGDKLAERNYEFKEIEQEKILNLRNKLIELFVDNEEIAWGIKNAWEYVNEKVELIDYNKSKSLFSQDNLLIALLKKYNQKLVELDKSGKLDYQILHDLIVPYLWKNKIGIKDLLDVKNINIELVIAELRYLHEIYMHIEDADIFFISSKTDEYTREWERETVFDDYAHLSEERIDEYTKAITSSDNQLSSKQTGYDRMLFNSETGKSIATKYVDILAKYSNTDKVIDKETKYIEILEFAFYVGDKLAERNYEFKEIEPEKILNLRNKLIELFVDNEEIAWGIKNAWEYVNEKIELIDYNKSKALFSQDNLLIALLKKYNQKLAELDMSGKLEYQILHDLIIPYSWEHKTGIKKLLKKNINIGLVIAELKYLHEVYVHIEDADIFFISSKTDEYTREWDRETIFDDYAHLSEEKVDMYYRLFIRK